MASTALYRLLVALVFLAGTMAVPVFAPGGSIVVAGEDDYGDDDNEGHGNDDDDDDRDEDDDHQGDGGSTGVSPAAPYTVDVTCEPITDGTATACSFTPLAPEDGKKVSHLLVPEDVACADVVGGSGDYVDPDPNVRVTGYRFTGNGPYTLEFDGTVQASDSAATYWVKAASGVYPATGPGLTCDAAATLDESTPGLGTDSPPAATTGTVVIETHACTGATSESRDFDWYGACPVDVTDHRFLLSAVGEDTTPLLAASTGETGTATFADLGAGAYHLEDTGDRWCHAESDNVNADANVVVETGAVTIVWLFYCR
jgi:hypothetical protein